MCWAMVERQGEEKPLEIPPPLNEAFFQAVFGKLRFRIMKGKKFIRMINHLSFVIAVQDGELLTSDVVGRSQYASRYSYSTEAGCWRNVDVAFCFDG